MRFSDLAVRIMLDALDEAQAAGARFGALHTAYSTTGANEVTGGSPSYARKALTWSAASGRSKATSGAAVFDVPAGTTVRWIGLSDAVTAGNFLGMVPNGGGIPEDFACTDTSGDILAAPGHGFSNSNTVVVWSVPGVALPSPLAEGTVYYVISATTDTLQLSLTSGGASVAIATTGAGFIQRLVEEVFGSQGTHTVTTATMTLD